MIRRTLLASSLLLASIPLAADNPPRMNLTLTRPILTICQLSPEARIPAWAAEAKGFVSITRTAEELSIVCAADAAPAGVKQEPGWRAFRIDGPLDFGLTGILASVLDPLAKAGVSIFALSTFNTDYVLVKEAKVGDAVQALRAAGHTISIP